jgi:class 3 adenylate cyclase
MSATNPPAGRTPSQRTLAAIVFTDVVSFSARMHADEVGTLKLLQRDFGEMRRICADHEGAVLKTTGDGLLLTFASAVQAVACALAMQRQFAAEAASLAAGEALQHRIGIHLGDVLVQDEDVMGDGVNIAARLQSEAEPGGICISQTVYDVVKNKLQMKVVSLGARELKNIAQAMPVYRLLLEAQALEPGARPNFGAPPAPPAPSRKRWLVIGGSAVAVAVVLAVGVILSRRAPTNPPPATVAAGTAAAPASQMPAAAPPVAAGQTSATNPPAAAGADLAGDLANEYAKRRDLLQQLHTLYLDKYDFSGMVMALRDKGESPTAPASLQNLLHSAEFLVKLRGWLEVALRHYGRDHPLPVHDLSGDASKNTAVYLAADLRVVFVEGAALKPRDWAEIKPAEMGAIIVSAIRELKESSRTIIIGAQVFAKFYSLPAMTAALPALKPRAPRETPPNKP